VTPPSTILSSWQRGPTAGIGGRLAAGEPGAANYDPTKANPYPHWPEVLTLKDGRKVRTAERFRCASPPESPHSSPNAAQSAARALRLTGSTTFFS